MLKALCEEKPENMENTEWKEMEAKAMVTIWLCLFNDVMNHVMDEHSPVTV